jgi:hypothetical protein
MNIIIQTTLDYWRRTRTKIAPSGWEHRNSVCCHHRGDTPDKRGRGGIKTDGRNISYHCFQCGFTANYTPGKPLYPKFINLLTWLNVDEKTISHLKLESFRISKEIDVESSAIVRRDIKEVDLPNGCSLLELEHEKETHKAHIEFLKTRGFEAEDFPFLVSPNLTYRTRVILPFILHNTIVGYSARSIVQAEKLRYLMKTTTDFVFGLDWVKPEHEWVFVTEGLFDALSVKCLAVMHNEISDAQTEMICDLQKKVIVVPDLDRAGLANQNNTLINTALDNGWSVSFPQWPDKDINAAYVKYGQLFVIKHLLDQATDSTTTIRVKQKLLLNELKSRKDHNSY